MTVQCLICAVDQRTPRAPGMPYRSHKHRPGQIIFVKQCYGSIPVTWGRMEGPRGGSIVLEVTGADLDDLQPYRRPLTNLPRLDWSLAGGHARVTAVMPPWATLDEVNEEDLTQFFPRTLVSVQPWAAVFDLPTEPLARRFTAYFERIYRDVFRVDHGPRWIWDERACAEVAFQGGFGRCGFEAFRSRLHDRAGPRMLELAA